MKKKTLLKIAITIVAINTILSIANMIINYNQSRSIRFNEHLYDVFLEL